MLHVLGGFGAGGVETWLRDLARERPDWEFCLLAGEVGELGREVEAFGNRLHVCSLARVVTFPLRFWRLVRGGRYDIVHSHVLLFSGCVLALAGLAGVRSRIAHAHNSQDGAGEGPLRRAYRSTLRRLIWLFATEVVGCSSGAVEFVDSVSPRWLVPYGVGAVGGAKVEGRGMPRPYRVGALGRLTPHKGYARLIEEFVRTPDNFEVVIWGDGPLRDELRNLAGDRVRLAGVTHDPGAALGSLDAFVMPSEFAGLPRALLEAQAVDLPCLISEAVSDEAVVIPELVERLPRDGGWPEAIERTIAGRL